MEIAVKLGVSVASDLPWNEHISSVAKSAARKIGFLFRSRRFLTSRELLTLYKAQIRPCLIFRSQLWREASKHFSCYPWCNSEKIDDQTHTDSLFYRFYHGMCSGELKSVIPPNHALCITHVLPIPNTISRLNWKSAGPLHSPIRLSPWI